ncbi:hypothetical protein GE09DRAFT_489311 [Coniochaeta sp. 2T2.1]|nr:hypothetical protein GE09DRAFT_489311 [Coniochaeta sp. 2T2.1]
MSGDQQPPSFGDTNAQPPTPKQTTNSSIFPSPVFETPRQNQGGRFDESSGGWTPRFAEEYSVFNSTPGNLRGGTDGPFGDIGGSLTPYIPQTEGQKRPLTAEGIAAEIATHVNHYISPNPNLPLPPVLPSHRLQSSPGQPASEFSQPSGKEDSQQRSRSSQGKKRRRDTIDEESHEEAEEQGQTVTPPPSARKGHRKLAPKLDLNAMHNDQGFSQQDFINGSGQQQQQQQQQQQNMGTFMTTPSDMFGYPLSAGPMSAPVTGPGAFGNQQGFWGPNPNMAGMDIDYSGAGGADVFQQQAMAQQGTMEALEWARANQMFQQAGGMHQQNQENMQAPPVTGGRPLASKAVMPPLDDAPSNGQSMYNNNYPAQLDNPFGIMANTGGVNPGLLFSRPPSSSLTAEAFNQAAMPPSSSAPLAPQQQHAPPAVQPRGPPVQREGLRRSMSSKELGPSGRLDRSSLISPTKASNRPGLSRSFSESKGKKPMARATLPALAPAPRPQTSLPSTRPSSRANGNGRTSPLKSDHHHRLSSLSSIPESASLLPRTRTQAKFTIDANGRAKVETTVFVDPSSPPRLPPPLSSSRKRNNSQSSLRQHQHQQPQWPHHRSSRSPSDDDDSDASSTDDEPIIIPSRPTSFVLPDPIKATRKNPLHQAQRSISDRSTASYATFGGQSYVDDIDEPDSEAETVMNEQTQTPTGGRVGDAVSELKRLRESRRAAHHQEELPSPTKHKRLSFAGAGAGGGGSVMDFPGSNSYPRHTALSPGTEASLPTPDSSRAGQGVRCICNRSEVDGDFMVQCESCEMWLHGRCVNISKRTVPSVYICLFCANTPNMRGGRIRANGRVSVGSMDGGGMEGAAAQSPLAHKGFKSFR